jgi:signal transduction histidine kinase
MTLHRTSSRAALPVPLPSAAIGPQPPRSAWTLRPPAEPVDASPRSAARLVGPVAHELRNFLTPMRLSFEILQRAVGRDSDAAAALAMLRSQTEDLSRLVGDLLDAGRADAGKLEVRLQDCVLQDVAKQSVRMCAAAADDWGQRLVLECTQEPLNVQGDPLRLRQALTNLILNAVRYSPPGGRVRVQVLSLHGMGLLRVHDDGAGMAPEFARHAFDPYAQDEEAGAPGALGIGLYLVRSIAQLHGGRARAVSGGAGRGTTFTIELPLDTGAAH